MLASAVNRTEGSTLFLRISVPQQTILELVKEQREKDKVRDFSRMIPKKPARKATRRRARRR